MKTITKVYGFTLVEIIVGIVVLSIALMGGLSLLISQVDTFKDPLIREKSAQISKRIIHEIQIRSFDEKSDIGGGLFRCGETVSGVSLGECTPLQDYGPDSSERMHVPMIICRLFISFPMLPMQRSSKNTMIIMPILQ